MVQGLLVYGRFKANPLLSIGTRGDSRGATQVNALLNTKFPCVMQQGGKASVTLFRYVAHLRLYPCSITGAPELGYLHLRAFARSTRRSIRLLRFCLAFTIPSEDRLLGSLEIALKRTRPRQRF